MIIAKALGAQIALTGGYLGGVRSYLPPRALVLQGSAIAVSALIQTYRPFTQGALAKHMPRLYAFMLLNFEPFILIGTMGIYAKVGWKVNLAATLFFSILQLGLSKYVSIETNAIPTEEKAKALLQQFEQELQQGQIDHSAITLKQILELRQENPFVCVALILKELYAEGVMHFCGNLPKDRAAAIRWYNGIDSTVYRLPKDCLGGPAPSFIWNNLYARLIRASLELEIKKDWLKEIPPLPTHRNYYLRELALTFDPKYSDHLSRELSNIWEENYYLYLFKVKGKKLADDYLRRHQVEDLYTLQQSTLILGENSIAFHCLIKELETSPGDLESFVFSRGNLFLTLEPKNGSFQTFEDRVPEQHRETFRKIRDYLPELDEIYEL